VDEDDKATVDRLLQKRNAETAGRLVSLGRDKWGAAEAGGGGSKRRRCPTSHSVIGNRVSPLLLNDAVRRGHRRSGVPSTSFFVPYLKGKPAQFEGKVAVRINKLLLDSEPPPLTPVQKNAMVVQTRKTNLQMKTQWRNEKLHEDNIGERKKTATREATETFCGPRGGEDYKPKDPAGIYRQIDVDTAWTVRAARIPGRRTCWQRGQ